MNEPKNGGEKMTINNMTIDKAINELKYAQKLMNESHVAACAALTTFDMLYDDKSLDMEIQDMVRNLRTETLIYCEQIRKTLKTLPDAASADSFTL